MERLVGLIKMQKWKVDEKRRQIAELEGSRAELVSKIATLEEKFENEKRLMREQNIPANFPAYSTHFKAKRAKLEKSVAEFDVSINGLRNELAELFRELKQYETLVERRRQRALDKRMKAEQAELDEIGLNIHRKLKDDGQAL